MMRGRGPVIAAVITGPCPARLVTGVATWNVAIATALVAQEWVVQTA